MSWLFFRHISLGCNHPFDNSALYKSYLGVQKLSLLDRGCNHNSRTVPLPSFLFCTQDCSSDCIQKEAVPKQKEKSDLKFLRLWRGMQQADAGFQTMKNDPPFNTHTFIHTMQMMLISGHTWLNRVGQTIDASSIWRAWSKRAWGWIFPTFILTKDWFGNVTQLITSSPAINSPFWSKEISSPALLLNETCPRKWWSCIVKWKRSL